MAGPIIAGLSVVRVVVVCLGVLIACIAHPGHSLFNSARLRAIRDAFHGITTGNPPISEQATVIVVGSGLAGTTAALAAVEADPSVRVLLIEKQARTGGNSAKASSGINAVSPPDGDSREAFIKDTLRSGGGKSNPALVATLVDESEAALQWMASFGLNFSSTVQLGGHSHCRTHFPPGGLPVGIAILKQLGAALEAEPRIQVVTDARVVELAVHESRVVGVQYEVTNPGVEHLGLEKESLNSANEGASKVVSVPAGAVVLATGGYAANRDLLKSHAPKISGLATTNGAFAQGEGLELARSAGGFLVDLDSVQVHPTAFVDPANETDPTKHVAPEKLRGMGGVLLDSNGRRFVNELATRDMVTAAMLRQPTTKAWLVLDQEAGNLVGPALGFYVSKGLIRRVEGIENAAVLMSVRADILSEEIEEYNKAARGERVDTFGRSYFRALMKSNGLLYIAQVTPAIHYCMGGALIDADGHVLSDTGKPIVGLYAAGEVAGGVHGRNRLGGNSLLECCVFGRRAGRAAAMAAVASKNDRQHPWLSLFPLKQ